MSLHLVVVLGFALETEEADDTHLDVPGTVRVVGIDLGPHSPCGSTRF